MIPEKAKQPAFIIISMIFLAVTDIISAVGMIISALIISGYARFSVKVRKKRILFFLLTTIFMLFYILCFVSFSFYNAYKFKNVNSILRFLPVGIAFFYLQAIRFTADIYKGKLQSAFDVNDVMDYLLFYPRLVMGPVMTYNEHKKMLSCGKQNLESIGNGLSLFTIGLSKKVLIADTIGLVFAPLYGNLSQDNTMLMSWLTVIAFALEIFFILSGYGDMAKGIAMCYGFDIAVSYKHPLLSGSLSRFNDEWNISVVSWFKSMFAPMLRPEKSSYISGTMFVWILVGMWCRPVSQMIIWGAWLGLWIGLDGYLRVKFSRIPSVVNNIVFFIATLFGWAFFSADSIAEGLNSVGLLLGTGTGIASSADLYYIRSAGLIMIIAAYISIGNFGALIKHARRISFISKAIDFLSAIMLVVLLILCIVVISTNIDITSLQVKGVI